MTTLPTIPGYYWAICVRRRAAQYEIVKVTPAYFDDDPFIVWAIADDGYSELGDFCGWIGPLEQPVNIPQMERANA